MIIICYRKVNSYMPLLRGYDLISFVDGGTSSPPPFLPIQNTFEKVPNPEFATWFKLLLSWLLIEPVLAQVIGL